MSTHQQIRSHNPHHFRSGQWACIYDERVINGRKQWLVAWDDWVFDYWLQEDPEAKYEFRDCEIEKEGGHDSESEARASGQGDPVG